MLPWADGEKNHMYEYSYELLILKSNLGLPLISDVDRAFEMIAQCMVTGVKFGNTNPVAQRL